ncbi:alpha/beta fold hydrolase [Vallicoccus soli]|uniref:alpha/beta fold hydrolase n=1 Tax=Vallicoccus soli TaxID=2339232 RepID=UPI001C49AE0F|nr:alpha/beta hydrolase [Vallicoccus soli]
MLGTLHRPGGTLGYDVAGDGPLVVLAHGMGDLRGTYRRLAPALRAAGHRVAALDLRGHGDASTGWDDVSTTAVAGDLLALVEELGGPAVLVGSSYSGGAAVVAAARRPDLVAGLVLSGAFVRDVPRTRGQRAAAWLVARTPLGRPLWSAYVPSLYGTRPDDLAEHRRALAANLREPGRWAAVAAMARAGHAASEAVLGDVRAPALVVVGCQDPDFADPAEEARRTAAALGGPADVLLVDGAGHYPHLERPDVVTPAVLALARRAAVA